MSVFTFAVLTVTAVPVDRASCCNTREFRIATKNSRLGLLLLRTGTYYRPTRRLTQASCAFTLFCTTIIVINTLNHINLSNPHPVFLLSKKHYVSEC